MSFCLIVVFRIVIMLSLPLLFVGSLYGFLWTPQLYRSVRRGRSSGLHAEYVIGVTLCRLFFILCEHKSLAGSSFNSAISLQTSSIVPRTFWTWSLDVRVICILVLVILTVYAAWIWCIALVMGMQIGIILLQERLGPTFFLPQGVRWFIFPASPCR